MPRYTTLVDEIFVQNPRTGGWTALSDFRGVVVEKYPFVGDSARRGDNDVIPGRYGQIGATKPLDSYSFSIPIGIMGIDTNGLFPNSVEEQRMWALVNLRGLIRALSPFHGLVNLKRRIQNYGETYPYYEQTCNAEFVAGSALDFFVPEAGKTELEFINLDGCWYSLNDNHEELDTSPKTITINGEYITKRISITLPSAGTLENNTAGVSVTVLGACTLDVESYTASSGLDTLTHSGDVNWFVLWPSDNTITWSGNGTPSFDYRGAYL